MTRLSVAEVVLLFLSGSVLAQQAQYQKHGPALLPDPAVTKGKVALTNKAKICATKWGRDERHVTRKMKADVYAAYGTAPGKGVCAWKTRTTRSGSTVREGCEVDHLISRELGGADAEVNLWPQPYTQHPGAHEKDWLENKLHKEVCANKISLSDAQQEIGADWYAAYLKRKAHANPSETGHARTDRPVGHKVRASRSQVLQSGNGKF